MRFGTSAGSSRVRKSDNDMLLLRGQLTFDRLGNDTLTRQLFYGIAAESESNMSQRNAGWPTTALRKWCAGGAGFLPVAMIHHSPVRAIRFGGSLD